MKKGYISILLFGSILAFLAISLHFLEYKYYVGSLDSDIYTSVVATFFTIMGIWIGTNILKNKKATSQKPDTIKESKCIEKFNLNDREYEILHLIAKGLSNKEIAEQLFLALPTIKTHISNLYLKLDVKSRTQAIYKAQSLNLI